MSGILNEATEGAVTIVIRPSRAKTSVGVKLLVMKKPHKGFTAWRGCIAPNERRKGVVR